MRWAWHMAWMWEKDAQLCPGNVKVRVNLVDVGVDAGGLFLGGVSRNRQRKRDILVGTWNVRSLCRAGALTAVARELLGYKLEGWKSSNIWEQR
jgi:hypothetical protein